MNPLQPDITMYFVIVYIHAIKYSFIAYYYATCIYVCINS